MRTTVVLTRAGRDIAAWPLPGDAGPVEARPVAALPVAACPDLSVVDQLARMQVAAHCLGCAIRLRNPSHDLCLLLDFAGLTDEVIGRQERVSLTWRRRTRRSQSH